MDAETAAAVGRAPRRRAVGGRAEVDADPAVARAAALRTFVDEQGRTLYDLFRAPLPDAEVAAPPRLVPRFDNLVLSHADRSRILGDIPPSRLVTNNGLVHATILVDGFVAGTWQLERGRVVLEPFGKLGSAARRALKEEAELLEAFVA